ncbi:hypothetical protein [Paenibacillus donghaensis]|uniref:Uncharacterized protein n=1 Tax=Paenibacillus donghaensis TaxID=414771 RepID=A0A2Z2KLR8_9BACL|nr:hypothetical protein [Paenibacillus donghaensis]ASA20941.1 hypothetical protein B9T62_09180 [Paenibacillus donghaensis]
MGKIKLGEEKPEDIQSEVEAPDGVSEVEQDTANEPVIPSPDAAALSTGTIGENSELDKAGANGDSVFEEETAKREFTAVLESVLLKSWEEGSEGIHTIHIKRGIFNFVNGKAEILPESAAELRQAGYIE